MPLYEFHCRRCNHNSELIVPFSRRYEQRCENCYERLEFLPVQAPAVQYSYPAGHPRAGRGGTGHTNAS